MLNAICVKSNFLDWFMLCINGCDFYHNALHYTNGAFIYVDIQTPIVAICLL